MFNRNWNRNHEESWKTPLELNNEGLSNFQAELLKKIKELLYSNSIKFIVKNTEHIDLNNSDRKVKMITILLTDLKESQIWIYNDMAEYEINKIHHIYEEWGYLTPIELQEKYIKNIREILKIK
ncbi:hypothetical protein [Flavobacterium sp. RS13.1]|uniref:hypothetical protein n=1 Tax=Flavobacterium sp. RS13.1 TaxID=3400345 RepID=UPI003AAD1041